MSFKIMTKPSSLINTNVKRSGFGGKERQVDVGLGGSRA